MIRRLAFAAALALTPLTAAAAPAEFTLDPDHTTVAFLVDHVGYSKILGQFTSVSGGFTYDEETQTLSDVRVVVDAASFFSNHEARDRHVLGGDFLNAETHPEIVFTASGGTVTGEGQGQVNGEMTLLGETRPMVLDVTLNKAEAYPFGHKQYTLGISIRGSVLRSEWGMTYGVANGLVGDEVEIIAEVEALRAE
ncbi:MAG: YceI family protein [Pseudomonadota bacterium]